MLKIENIHEDESILIINKPPAVVVNRALSVQEPTLQDYLEANFDYPIVDKPQFRSGIVHRIDKDTSGLLIIAKTAASFENIQRQFKERKVEKTYIALVHGILDPPEGHIRLPLARNPLNRQKWGVYPGGKVTVTSYRAVKFFPKNQNKPIQSDYQGYTLVEVYPLTGRTHQIRVVFAFMRHPLVGDIKYLSAKKAKEDLLWTKRHFLHAHKISFFHPDTGGRVNFSAQLPHDLNEILTVMESQKN